MSEYSIKLKDPRWQKKRLEIFERDNWTCQYCGDKNNTLNVHHKDYDDNIEPWDYPDEWLITLCDECHEGELNDRLDIEKELLHYLRIKFDTQCLSILCVAFECLSDNTQEELWWSAEVISYICQNLKLRNKLKKQFIKEIYQTDITIKK